MSTPRLGHEPVPMRRVYDYQDVNNRGDFFWEQRPSDGAQFISMAIPCTPDSDGRDWEFICIQVCRSESDKTDRIWLWDGNNDQPTLSPSIHTHHIWHGWVKGGVMSEA